MNSQKPQLALAICPVLALIISILLPFISELGLAGLAFAQYGLVATFMLSIIAAVLVKGRLKLVPLLAIVLAISAFLYLAYSIPHIFDNYQY